MERAPRHSGASGKFLALQYTFTVNYTFTLPSVAVAAAPFGIRRSAPPSTVARTNLGWLEPRGVRRRPLLNGLHAPLHRPPSPMAIADRPPCAAFRLASVRRT